MKIVIDAGHGGVDPGAVNPGVGVEEKALNLQIALALQDWLEQDGQKVVLTRDSDHFVSLVDRVVISNKEKPDAFISIHCNAAGNVSAKGTEVWTTPGETKADALASAICKKLIEQLPTTPLRRDESDGDLDKEGRLYVLIHTNCPAVLVECGFISNDQEAIWMKDLSTIQSISHAIVLGLYDWKYPKEK